eukprot:Colp12_sorted_trinity150504_noHs@20244
MPNSLGRLLSSHIQEEPSLSETAPLVTDSMDGVDSAYFSIMSSKEVAASQQKQLVAQELTVLGSPSEQDPSIATQPLDASVSVNVPQAEGEGRQKAGVHNMVGGWPAYIFRRVWHVVLNFAIPYIYYFHLGNWFGDSPYTKEMLIATLGLLYVVFEAARLYKGILFFGMRDYEKDRISAMGWSVVSLVLVMLIAPHNFPLQGRYGMPIIWSLGIGDPLLGEMRARKVNLWLACGIAGLAVLGVWLAAIFWLGAHWWVVPFIVPITIAAEYPSLGFIDDNATMLLIPLAFIVLVSPFF